MSRPPTPPHFPAALAGPSSQAAHLWQCPLCPPHLDADPDRDAQHGGQGHEPADAIAPGRVGVHVVVLEGLVFDQEENEDALQRDGERSLGWPSAWCGRPVGEMVDPVQWPRRGGILPVHSEKHREQTPHVPGDPPRPPRNLISSLQTVRNFNFFFSSYFSGLVSKLTFKTKMVGEDALRYFQCQGLGEEQRFCFFD